MWRQSVLDEKLSAVSTALSDRLAACETQLGAEERERRAAVDEAVAAAKRQWAGGACLRAFLPTFLPACLHASSTTNPSINQSIYPFIITSTI